MKVECKICGKKYSMITNTHLKTHNTNVEEYSKKYGKESLTSADYRINKSKNNSGKNNPNYGNKWTTEMKENISQKNKGKTPWNKNKRMPKEFCDSLKVAFKYREEKYKKGILKRPQKNLTEDQKNHLSYMQKQYAKNNPDKMSERARRAKQTLRERGYDFGSVMRGKKLTEETKRKISIASIKSNEKRREVIRNRIKNRLKEQDLVLIGDIDDYVIQMKCNKDGTYFGFTRQYFTDSKYTTKMCPTCYPRIYNRSKGEKELYNFIKEYCPDAQSNVRYLLQGNEVDVFIPSKNIAFEYNGLYWHSQELFEFVGKHKHSDFQKYLDLKDKGYQLFSVYEDEMIHKRDIVESRIKTMLGVETNTIYGRKCVIAELDPKTCNSFLNENHLQGSGRSNIRYGLYYKDELVSVMTFSNSNISRKMDTWEINRFCSKKDTRVIGAANKLFKGFLKETNPKEIISYSDNRWGKGELYRALGFEKVSDGRPNYWYFAPNGCRRIHRFSLRKNKKDDPNLTEYENRLKQGYRRIWDCGHSKWLWTRTDK